MPTTQTPPRAGTDGEADPAALELEEAWEQAWTEAIGTVTRTVLDLGTGDGALALQLARLGHHVTGIDHRTDLLEIARRRAREMGPGAPMLLPGDVASPPLARGGFDVLTSRSLLRTLGDAPAALRSWAALLRPGGLLVAVDDPWSDAGIEEIRALVEEAGFEDVRIDPLPGLLALDLRDGVAPGHEPQLQHRLIARTPARRGTMGA